jgi:hypothetical protein
VHTHVSEKDLLKRTAGINFLMKGAGITYHNKKEPYKVPYTKNHTKFPILFIRFGNLPDEQISKVFTSLKQVWLE